MYSLAATFKFHWAIPIFPLTRAFISRSDETCAHTKHSIHRVPRHGSSLWLNSAKEALEAAVGFTAQRLGDSRLAPIPFVVWDPRPGGALQDVINQRTEEVGVVGAFAGGLRRCDVTPFLKQSNRTAQQGALSAKSKVPVRKQQSVQDTVRSGCRFPGSPPFLT